MESVRLPAVHALQKCTPVPEGLTAMLADRAGQGHGVLHRRRRLPGLILPAPAMLTASRTIEGHQEGRSATRLPLGGRRRTYSQELSSPRGPGSRLPRGPGSRLPQGYIQAMRAGDRGYMPRGCPGAISRLPWVYIPPGYIRSSRLSRLAWGGGGAIYRSYI